MAIFLRTLHDVPLYEGEEVFLARRRDEAADSRARIAHIYGLDLLRL
jgi:hypothetical protein